MGIKFKYRFFTSLLFIIANFTYSNVDIERSRFKNLYYFIDSDSLRNHKLILPHRNMINFSLVRMKPSIKLYREIPDLRNNLSFFGKTKNYHFYIESIITNDFYKNHVLGSNYSRSNISGRISNAFIKMYNKSISFQFGRSPISWGSSSRSSIITSGYQINYDHILLQMDLSEFSYEFLTGQLGSEKTTDGEKINRYIAGHKLIWHVSNDFVLGFGEMIIYTGVNRGLDLTYLNPFVPYFFSALEGDEQTHPYDNANSMIFAYGKYGYEKNASIFIEFIVDEYQVDNTGIENALGIKIGFQNEKIFFNKKISTNVQWTKIDPWTYIHHGQYTSWQNKGHSLGFLYGPDAECLQLKVIVDVFDDLFIRSEFKFLKKGTTYLDTNWNNVYGYKLDTSFDEYTLYDFSIIKMYRKTIFEAGLSYMPFSNTIAFNNNGQFPTRNSAYLQISYLLDKTISFN